MDDFSAFTDGERALLEALERRGVPFMMVGLGAAVLQGANSATRDIDLWFKDLTDERIAEAAREANAIWVSGALGMRPPQFGGDVVGDRLDVVTHIHRRAGKRAFDRREWDTALCARPEANSRQQTCNGSAQGSCRDSRSRGGDRGNECRRTPMVLFAGVMRSSDLNLNPRAGQPDCWG
jgi:hypothetical protein